MIQKRNTGFAAHKQSHKYRFCGLEAEPGFKQKHSGEKKQHSKASFSVLSTWLKKHTEKAKRDREREREGEDDEGSTYPKSSREYMSLKESVQSSGKGWKEV